MSSPAALKKLLLYSELAKVATKKKTSQRKHFSARSDAGFSLLEVIVVVVMVGILAAIAAPSWFGFVNQRRANAAHEAVWRALQEAQSQAKRTKLTHGVSFRQQGDIYEMAIHDGDTPDADDWQPLGQELELQQGQLVLQTNVDDGEPNQAGGNATLTEDARTITFDQLGTLPSITNPNLDGDDDGTPEGLIVLVGLRGENGNPVERTQRCVKVTTLLGALKNERGSQCNLP